MTITRLLLNFRDALIAVVPMVEKVGMPWKRPDGYDEWDAIATALFDNLVKEIILQSLSDEERQDVTVAEYDLLQQDYAGASIIEVVHPSFVGARWRFHAFATMDNPFDLIEVQPWVGENQPSFDELITCPVSEAQFLLRLVKLGGSDEAVDEIVMQGDSL